MPSLSPDDFLFRVEALESRILLSATPLDAGPVDGEAEEAGTSLQQVELGAEGEETPSPADPGTDPEPDLFAGASPLEAAPASGAAEAPTDPAAPAADSALLRLDTSPEAGASLAAEVIEVADGVQLDGVRLEAARVSLGAVTWAGESVVLADEVAVEADPSARPGARLELSPRDASADLLLGTASSTATAARFVLDSAEIDRLAAAGLAELTVGQAGGQHDHYLDGLAYHGDLTLRADGAEGDFYVLSEVRHSGGQLQYLGSGQTQNTSANTVTDGAELILDESVRLVRTDTNNNTILFDTTGGLDGDGNPRFPEGANILIEGSVFGSDFGDGGTLQLNAGTRGEIRIEGDVGTVDALGKLEILQAADVVIEGDLLVGTFVQHAGQGNTTLGTDSTSSVQVTDNPSAGDPEAFEVTTTNSLTVKGDFSVTQGNAKVTLDRTANAGKVHFEGPVSVAAGDLTVVEAKDLQFDGATTVGGTLTETTGTGTTIFNDNLQAGVIDLRADTEVRFEGEVSLTSGDLTLVSDEMNFNGGAGSLTGALDGNGAPATSLYLRPTDGTVSIDLGDPTGASGVLHLSGTDLAAIGDGMALVRIGHTGGGNTNAITIAGATFKDRTEIYGGTFLINGALRSQTLLRLDADSKDGNDDAILIDGAQLRVTNEQVDSVWGDSEIHLRADTGDLRLRNDASLLIENHDATAVSEGSVIRLEATAGAIVNEEGSNGLAEGRELFATAAGALTLRTAVDEITAESTGAGDLTLSELNGVRILKGITANGAIAVDTGGDTVVDLLRSDTDAAANPITVTVFAGDLTVDEVLAGTAGDVTLTVEGALTGTDETDPQTHITADLLTLVTETGIGTSANPLKVLANEIDFSNTISGAVHLRQNGGRSALAVSGTNAGVGAQDYVALTVLGTSGTATATTVAAAGLQADSAAGVLLDTSASTTGTLTLNGEVDSAGGPLTIDAYGAVTVAAGVTLSSGGGDVLLRSVTGAVTFASDASVTSGGGDLAVLADGTIAAGILDARGADTTDRSTWGALAVTSTTGAITDATAGSGSSPTTNFHALRLLLRAATGIGALATDPADASTEGTLELDAVTLAATTAGGVIALRARDDLETGQLAGFTPTVLAADGSTGNGPALAALGGVIHTGTTGAADILLSSDANLTVSNNDNAGGPDQAVVTSGAGHLVLSAATLDLQGYLRSAGGNLSLTATNNLTLSDAADAATSGSGTLYLASASGAVLGAAGSQLATAAGDLLLEAAGNLTLGTVHSSSGGVGIRSTSGSVLTATGGTLDRTVVTAESLTLAVDGAVAGADGAGEDLRTAVSTLTLSNGASGTVYGIRNSGDLRIDATSTSATSYDTLRAATTESIAAQSDFQVGGAGEVRLTVVGGDLTVGADHEISTTGTGAITVTVTAEAAAGGDFLMEAAADLRTADGAVTVTADGSAALGRVESTNGGDLSVTATSGAITDADPAETGRVDFATSGQLTLVASTGIGIAPSGSDLVRHPLTVTLGTLRASTATGGIFVGSDTSFTTNGLRTTAGTTPVVLTSGGTITLGPDATDALGGGDPAMAVDATGGLVLEAGADLVQVAGSTITAGADSRMVADATTGTITLAAVTVTDADLSLSAGGAVLGYANPTADAITADGLLLDEVASLGSPTQRVRTNVDTLAGTVDAGTVALDNQSSLTLGAVSVTTVDPAGTGNLGSALPTATATAERLVVAGSSGDGIFATVAGTLTVAATGSAASTLAVSDALPVLFQSTGDQAWSGWFALDGGDLTLRTDGALALDGTTTSTTAGGHASLEVGTAFQLAAATAVDLGTGDLVLRAGTDATVAGSLTTTGRLAVIAGDGIFAGASSASTRLTATDLLLEAGKGVGSASSPLVTAASSGLAVSAGAAGVWLDNTGDITVTNLGWTVPSYQPDAAKHLAFSGFLGGLQAAQGGWVDFRNTGTTTVEAVQASLTAFPAESFGFAVVAATAGPAGNALSVLVNGTDDAGNPPSTFYDADSGTLTVTVRNDLTTLAEIVAAINADAAFPGTALLTAGPADGSPVFSVAPEAEKQFFAAGGTLDGVVSALYGQTAGGEEPVSAVAALQPIGKSYTIDITATDRLGAAANAFTVRLLDDGPGGQLAAGADEAAVSWDAADDRLDLFVNYGVTTVATLVDAINAAAAAVTDPPDASNFPFTAGFSASYDAATNAGDVLGDGPVTMVSNLRAATTLEPVGPGNDFSVEAVLPGPEYNGIEVRFLDDGRSPAAGVEASFDDETNLLTVTLASDRHTAAEVIAAINAIEVDGQARFSAAPLIAGNDGGTIQANAYQLSGGAAAARASATVRPVGANNAFVVTAQQTGADQNAITVRLVTDDSLALGTAAAAYDGTDRQLTISLPSSGASAANVVAAVNEATASLSDAVTATVAFLNDGTGTVLEDGELPTTTTYTLGGGSSTAPSSATLALPGTNNNFTVSATTNGDGNDGITVVLAASDSLAAGTATASYDATAESLTVTVASSGTVVNTVLAAINSGPNAGTIPLTAALAAENTGAASVVLAEYPLTSGGTGAIARATLNPAGDNNALFLEADEALESLQNIEVRLIDDGSLTDGSAGVTYNADSRLLLLHVQAGVTTAQEVIDTVNADDSLALTASSAGTSDGSGTFGLAAVDFLGGEDPVAPTFTTTLPGGTTVELVSTRAWTDTTMVGGTADNGIEVGYAIDDSLAAGTASAQLFEANGRRLLFLTFASESVPLQALEDALTAANLEFTVGNLAGQESTPVGPLAAVYEDAQQVRYHEGLVRVVSTDNLSLKGRVESQAGVVELSTATSGGAGSGDLTFDAATARIRAVDGLALTLEGAFTNNASTENPLLEVIGTGFLTVETGQAAAADDAPEASTEDVTIATNADFRLTGWGLSLNDADFDLDSAGEDGERTAVFDAVLSAAGTGTITAYATGDLTVTEYGNLSADTITLTAGSTTLGYGAITTWEGSASARDTLTLTSESDLTQSGTVQATQNLTVTSSTGGITMTGDSSATTVAGDLTYTAAAPTHGAIALTFLSSSGGGTIAVTAGAAITNAHTDSTLQNLDTSGLVDLEAVSGVGAIGTPLRSIAGTLEVDNTGTTGDVVLTESAIVDAQNDPVANDLTVTGWNQRAEGGWSVLTLEGGSVTFAGAAANANGTGAFLVDATGSITTEAGATLATDGGPLTLEAGTGTSAGTISLAANVTTKGGAIAAEASHDLLLADGITLSASDPQDDANGGTVALVAAQDLEVAEVVSLGGAVRLEATAGAVTRAAVNTVTNVAAADLQLVAGTALGSLASTGAALTTAVDRLAATAAGGVLAVNESDSLAVGPVTVAVTSAVADRTTTTTTWDEDRLLVSSGDAVLRTGSDLTLEALSGDPVPAILAVTGDLRLAVGGHFSLLGNATVTDGSAHLTSSGNAILAGTYDQSSSDATDTFLLAADGALTQGTGSTLTTADLDAILAAGGILTVNEIGVGTAALALTSGGNLLRQAATDGTLATVRNLTTGGTTHLTAAELRLQSGGTVGSVAAPLELAPATLTASATDGLRLDATGAVIVDSVAVTVHEVSLTGDATATDRTEAAQADVRSTAAGSVLLVIDGALTLRDGDADGVAVATGTTGADTANETSGALYLEAASLTAYADVRTDRGDATVVVGGNARWIAVAESSPGAGDATAAHLTSNAGDLYASVGGDLTLDDTTGFATTTGHLGVAVTGDLTVASLAAPAGYARIAVGGAIVDAGDSDLDLEATSLQLVAGTGIGTLAREGGTYDPLEIAAGTLSVDLAEGPLALEAAGDLTVGATAGIVRTLDEDGTSSVAFTPAEEALFGLLSKGGGTVSLVADGDLLLAADPDHDPASARPVVGLSDGAGTPVAGDLLLYARDTAGSPAHALTVNGRVTLAGGHATLRGTAGIALGADSRVETTGTGSTGTLTLLSASGGLTMASGARLSAVDGDVVAEVDGALAVAGITTAGTVSLTAGAALSDNEASATNVTAAALRLNAAGAIGASGNALDTAVDQLSVRTTDGALFLREEDGLTLEGVAANTTAVATDGTTAARAVALQNGVSTGGSNGTLVLDLAAGALTVSAGDPVSAGGAGRLRLQAPGAVTLNAEVTSGTGAISLLAGADLSLAGGVTVTTGASAETDGGIRAEVGGALAGAAESRFVATSGNIVLEAAADLTLGGLTTGGRAALVSTGGNLTGAGSTGFAAEVIASRTLLDANGGDRIQLTLETAQLAARSSGLLQLENDSPALTVSRVEVSSSTVTASGGLQSKPTLSLADLTTTAADGSVRLATTGTLTLKDGGDSNGNAVVAHGAGDVLLAADGALTADADVRSTAGNLSTVAPTITLGADTDFVTGSPGTILVVATDASGNGDVTMAPTASLTATDSTVWIDATDAVVLGSLTADRVAVTPEAGGITTADGVTTNLTATEALLAANTGIGTAGTPITLAVGQLAAETSASGGLFLEASEAVTVAAVSGINANTIAFADGAVAGALPSSGLSLSGLSNAGGGAVVLATTAGALTVDAPVAATSAGPVRLAAAAALDLNAKVTSETGDLTLVGGTGMDLASGVEVTTGTPGTVYLETLAGALVMDAAATVTATGSSARLAAAGDLTAGSVTAARLSLLSSGGALRNAVGASDNLVATHLRLQAEGAIGTGTRPLSTSAGTLSARSATDSLFLSEKDGLSVDAVAVTVNQVDALGGTSAVTDANQADLRTGAGSDGAIVLGVRAGNLSLLDGNGDGRAVDADGSGAVRLEVESGTLTANAGVRSGTGALTVLTSGTLLLANGADLTTGGTGTLDLESSAGALFFSTTSDLTTGSGTIRVAAATSLLLGGEIRTSGTVSLHGNTISDADTDGGIDVVATALRIEAATGAGSSTNPLETDIDTLAARATSGGLWIRETNGLTTGTVAATVQRVGPDASLSARSDSALSEVATTSGNGAVQLVVVAGDLVLADTDDDFLAAETAGAGSLHLETLASASTLRLDAEVVAATGTITLRSAGALLQDSALTNAVAATSGRLVLDAANGIGQTGTGVLRVSAGQLDLEQTGNANVYLEVIGSTEWVRGEIGNGVAANVYWTQASGTLTISGSAENGSIRLYSGRLILRAEGRAVILADGLDLRVDDRTDLTAGSLTQNGTASLTLGRGTSTLLLAGNWTMSAGSSVQTAPLDGHLTARIWGNAALAAVTVAGDFRLNVLGDLTRSATSEVDRIVAERFALRVVGDAGTVDNAVLYETARFDAKVDGLFRGVELDDLNLGRFGIRLDSGSEETLRVEVRGDGTVARVLTEGGELVDAGSGRLELVAPQEDLRVEAVVRGTAGATIAVVSTTGGVLLAENVLSEGTGRVEILAPEDRIRFLSTPVTVKAGTGGTLLRSGGELRVSQVESAGSLLVESLTGYVGGIEIRRTPNLVMTDPTTVGEVRAVTGASLLGYSPVGFMRLVVSDANLDRNFGFYQDNNFFWLRGGSF